MEIEIKHLSKEDIITILNKAFELPWWNENNALEIVDKAWEKDFQEGIKIIEKLYGLGDKFGEKLAKAPHENYREILEHLERIEELLKSEG